MWKRLDNKMKEIARDSISGKKKSGESGEKRKGQCHHSGKAQPKQKVIFLLMDFPKDFRNFDHLIGDSKLSIPLDAQCSCPEKKKKKKSFYFSQWLRDEFLIKHTRIGIIPE